MTDLVIRDQNAARLREIAAREHRPVEEVVSRMIDEYAKSSGEAEHVIDDVERAILTKIYAEARAYWREVGDSERLKLTDEQLDEQFWIIDPDGIPRLKSEQGTIQIPENPLLGMAKRAAERGQRSGRSDISSHFDEVMEEYIRRDMEERKKKQDGE